MTSLMMDKPCECGCYVYFEKLYNEFYCNKCHKKLESKLNIISATDMWGNSVKHSYNK
jgi:hypothetical protein